MAPTACTHPVSGTFHSPSGVLFAFPSRYWFTIGQLRVFSLGGWSPLVPKDSSDRVSRAPPYSISRRGRFRVRGYHPLWRAFPGASANAAATEAAAFPPRLRAGPLSLIATEGISVDFFSSGYLDISVPRVRLAHLCIQCAIAIEMAGFPHSEIPGSKSVCRLPEAYRRLRRPSSPSAAKASTECACSLDHMTEATQAGTQGARSSGVGGMAGTSPDYPCPPATRVAADTTRRAQQPIAQTHFQVGFKRPSRVQRRQYATKAHPAGVSAVDARLHRERIVKGACAGPRARRSRNWPMALRTPSQHPRPPWRRA